MFSFVMGAFVGTFLSVGLMCVILVSKCESDKERDASIPEETNQGE